MLESVIRLPDCAAGERIVLKNWKLWAGLALVIMLNLGLGAVVLLSGSGALAQDGCDRGRLAALELDYVGQLERQSRGVRIDPVRLSQTRSALNATIQACAAEIDVSKARIDGGGIWAEGISTRFQLFGSKWGANSPFNVQNPPATAGGTVTYSFMPNGVQLEGGRTNVAITSLPGFQQCFLDKIHAAFDAWEAVADIQFVEVADNGVSIETPGAVGHIRIGAHTMNGIGGELAHAYFPPPNGSLVSAPGDMHFDVAENWACSPGAGQFDIGFVALHEIGHSIGLLHEPTVLAVMNAFYNPALSGLQPDDISGAAAIYGSNPNVIRPPLLALSYAPTALELGGSDGSTLQLTIINANSTTSLTNVTVEQTMPPQLQVNPASLSHNCPGGQSETTASQLRLTGATLSPLANCVLTIKALGSQIGTFNTLATSTSAETGSQTEQSAVVPLRVIAPATGTYCATTHDPNWTGPIPIIDGNPNTFISSTINAPDFGTLDDLDIHLNLTHTYVGDLRLTLTHNSTTVSLLRNPNNTGGICSGNNVFIVFNDEAGTTVQTACINSTNADAYSAGASYRPHEALTAFDGAELNGTWTLRVTDTVATDTGHLVNWCLRPTNRQPAKLSFITQPTTTLAGAAINPTTGVQVRLLDANDNPVNDSGVPVTIAIGTNPSDGALSGTLTVNTVNGVATFTGLSIDIWGNGYTLAATSPSLTQGVSATFNVAPAPGQNLIRNGRFAAGMMHWGTFATPTLSDIQHQITGGIFEAFRTVTGTSAVVLQNTTVPIAGSVPLHIQLDLGNSSAVRKRVLLMAHSQNFSDFQVCTFWLPPGQPLTTYAMTLKTNQAWSQGASLSVYLASNDGQGYALLDNVSMVYQPGTPPEATLCFDPNVPPL
jgi:subtilisin-like proprotein convertase family protein